MNKILILFLLPIFLNAQADMETVKDSKWLTDFDKAIKVAKSEKKNVLVYFSGSDWCTPCKRLKIDLFESTEFDGISGDYVLLYVDIPRNIDLIGEKQMIHNKELLGKYNKKGIFPLLKILDDKGKALDEYSGYSMNGEVRYHLQLLNKYK